MAKEEDEIEIDIEEAQKEVARKERIKKILKDAWLNLGEIDEESLFNPMEFLMNSDEDDFNLRLAYIMSRPEYFSFICKEILNIQLLPTQCLFLQEMWVRKFPMLIATRGFGKSYGLALYALLRALLLDGRKVVVVGAAFRQSKILFEYIEAIWRNSPLLRTMCDERSGPKRENDRCIMRVNNSIITCLPLGDGQKIRGQRAHDIIADEFASIPRDIFENVVAGFGVVSSNPINNVQQEAARKIAEQEGFILEDEQLDSVGNLVPNQIIISGTAYYEFNHFAEYWKKWRAIITSRGDAVRVKEVFSGQEPPDNFYWGDYSIIRMPYELVPKGFMDADQISRSKATVHSGIYQMEFGAVFTKDSQGFFKMSLIIGCVPSINNVLKTSDGESIHFEAMLIGDPKKKYVMGVDPASEVDNFSIVLLELNKGYRAIVHCWTTSRSQHKDLSRSGYTNENDFYAYCARKIRDLMARFPTIHISLDAQGGGIAVMEALHDRRNLNEGELPIWPIIDHDDPKDTDGERGLHLLEMCQFAKYDWLSEANHGMKKDFEDKKLLFPYSDGSTLGLATADDQIKGRAYDTLEDCVLDIEELKNELSIIEISQTPAGRDRWDTPEVIVGVGKKRRIRKDRYSALLMANMAARQLENAPDVAIASFYGGFANTKTKDKKEKKTGNLYNGPAWFTEAMKGVY